MSNLNAFTNIPASLEDSIRTENWCYTKAEKLECEFTWIIPDFDLHVSRIIRNRLSSSLFSAANDSCQWFLEVKVIKYGDTSERLAIIVYSSSASSRGCSGNATVSLIDSKNEKWNVCQKKFYVENEQAQADIWFEKYVKCETLTVQKDKLLPYGALRIYCKLAFTRDIINISNYCPNFHECNLMHDFEILFKDEDTCDITININGKKYPAHKTILAARSPVFKAMFKHDMMENQQNYVEINDIDENIFEEVLQFIYTGKVTKLENIVFELMPVADKYDLRQLKNTCLNMLKTLLSEKTAVKTLILSDLNNLKSLKIDAIEYIIANLKKVQKSEGWNELMSRPDLMIDILNQGC